MPENASVGYQVIKLNVSDGDSSAASQQRMSFALHAARDLSSLVKFKIGPSDGTITVREKLDHELARSHLLTVSVKDQGTPGAKAGYARVAIRVADGNDHPPQFLRQVKVY